MRLNYDWNRPNDVCVIRNLYSIGHRDLHVCLPIQLIVGEKIRVKSLVEILSSFKKNSREEAGWSIARLTTCARVHVGQRQSIGQKHETVEFAVGRPGGRLTNK